MPKIPSAQPAPQYSVGQLLVVDPLHPLDVLGALLHDLVELAAADEADRELRRQPGGLEDRLEPMERDQLADEQEAERLVGAPARMEEAVLGADEADAHALAWNLAELGEEVRVRLRVGDDQVGQPERLAVDGEQDPGGEQPLPEALAVGDEGLVERDERVEDERPLARDPARARDVEVARVADDDGVEEIVRARSAAGAPPPPAGAPVRQRAAQLSRCPSQTGVCRSITSTPAPRSADMTSAFRG